MLTRLSKVEDFNSRILNGEGLSIVRFCARWSGPCHIMEPIYKEMSSIYSLHVAFYYVDIDEAPELKSQLAVIELPTIFLYRKGELIDYIKGLISRELFIDKLEKAMCKF
jgi:thioredoxin 1